MKKYRIIIVDDEEQFRSTISSCFPWEQLGFEVVAQASNGQEAWEYVSENRVDVIFSDIQMPVMNGLELAERISKMKKPPVLVFFSGYQEFEYAKKALIYGVRNYIVKPVRADELSETLKQVKKELDSQTGIAERAEMAEATEMSDDVMKEEVFVQTVQEYVKENLARASLAEIAEMLYMNQSYVSQLYKQKTGTNFSDYVLEMRMDKAVELLKNPAYRIYEVGELVGYSNPNNFTRAFRTFYGMTPKACQEKNLYRTWKTDMKREV